MGTEKEIKSTDESLDDLEVGHEEADNVKGGMFFDSHHKEGFKHEILPNRGRTGN